MTMYALSEVPTVVLLKTQVFRDSTPCRLVYSYRRFEGLHHLHLQGQFRLLGIRINETARRFPADK